MRSITAFLVVLSLFGCSQAKQEEAPVVPPPTVEEAVTEVKQEAALVAQEVKKDVASVTEQVREDVVPVVEEIKKEVASEIASMARPATPETAVEGGDAVISKGDWGFSVYDPGTKTTKYYTSDGSLLGKR